MGDRPEVRPDARKTLAQLRQEWSSCTRCDLGERRLSVGGKFVFGEGAPRGMMFIGEGPGRDEEAEGAPFIGRSGALFREVLERLGLFEYYVTNLVTCRSCVQQMDPEGRPIFRSFGKRPPEPVFKDEPPTPVQYMACSPRLYQEIYLVDPTVIVGLGGKACEMLLGKSVTITRDRGEPQHISIPGASWVPDLTEKRQEWLRKSKGGNTTPVDQNMVRYLLVPTLHPSYVVRKIADRGADSPFRQFVADVKKAIRVHEFYLETVYGIVPTAHTPMDEEELHQQVQDDNE